MTPDLSVSIGPLRLKNPVMAASGTFGVGDEYAEIVDISRLGAVVVKGISLEPFDGNPPPRIVEVPSGLINSIGLQNPGVEEFLATYLPRLRRFDVPVVVNIWGRSVEEYAAVTARLERAEGWSAVEINVSCPNVSEAGCLFSSDPELFRSVVQAVRAETRRPVIVKLAPDFARITAFARIAEECGADAVSAINSLPAMSVDIETWKPRLGNISGGLTGPAIHPVAVKMVWDICRAVRIPVIGIGGITTAAEAIEFFLVGARAVAVGTATFANPRAALEVIDGLRRYMNRFGLASMDELIGRIRI